MPSTTTISIDKLVRLVGTPHCPALVDVRASDDYKSNPRLIPSSMRRPHADLSAWGGEFVGRSAIVVCQKGANLSEGVSAWLRHAGVPADDLMIRGMAAVTVVTLGLAASALSGYAADKFQKLSGAQIRAKLTGMEMTDNVHFADVFGANGGLRTYAMGQKKDGKWRVEGDELCVDRGKDDGGCYQVWIAGKNVEFRREGLGATFEGILQRPAARN
jgi:rhodanese-related sulfurtransferase